MGEQLLQRDALSLRYRLKLGVAEVVQLDCYLARWHIGSGVSTQVNVPARHHLRGCTS